MAAVELVREILSSDNEDWKTWSFSFATQQGDKPYTVADLLEKVVNQDKLLDAGVYLTFLLFPHVLQTLFLKRTNDTFLNHRTHHFLINTSRNKGGKQPPHSHQQSIWLIHPGVTKSERL